MGTHSNMQADLYGLFESNKTFDYDDYEYKEEVCLSSRASDAVAVFIPLLHSVGLLLGLLGNGLVLAILWRKRLKLSVMDIFILHLSVTDCLLLFTLPLWAVDAVRGWIMGSELCKLAGALFKVNFYCSIFILTCISVDRYLSIVHGVQTLSHKKPVVVHCCCLIIWLLCLLLSIPDWIYLRSVHGSTDQSTDECIHDYPPDSQRLGSRIPYLVSFVLAALMLLFCYSSILLKLWHDSRCQQKMNTKTAVVTALMLFFFIFWTPYIIIFIINTARPVDRVSSAGADECEGRRWTGSKITAILGLLHCIVNPVIYFCLSKEFRRRALTMMKLSACDTDSNDGSLWDSSGVNHNASLPEEQPMNDIKQTIQTQNQNA